MLTAVSSVDTTESVLVRHLVVVVLTATQLLRLAARTTEVLEATREAQTAVSKC